MTHKRRLAPPPKGAPNISLGICINSDLAATAGKPLAIALNILRKRFGSSVFITLGMGGLDPLDSHILTKWLANGLIDQSICSGSESLVLNDLVDAAIRSNAVSAVFLDAGELLRSPARVLKFIVEHLGMEGGSSLSPDASQLHVGQLLLRELPKQRYPVSWQTALVFVHAGCNSGLVQEDEKNVHAAQTLHEPLHLFVTETGMQRLGGAARFKTLPLYLGGMRVDAFDKVTLLTLENEACAVSLDPILWPKIEAIRSVGDDDGVIFDIWPAPHAFGATPLLEDGQGVYAPRQILVGRRCPVPTSVMASTSMAREAVFVMSNYNKATYLHPALYGWVMQTHPSVRLEIVDDISTDASAAKIHEFMGLMGLNAALMRVDSNQKKRGTYWIRNSIILQHLKDDVVFFINDSDDVSSALRATLQLTTLATDVRRRACLFNIVRVDKNYSPLPLNGEVERYGTASLCFQSGLIQKVGYFQNLKKNADTEFIRRVKRFLGTAANPWIRHPVMFQPFDGKNLTADVYKIEQGSIAMSLDSRKLHLEIADRHHERLTLEDLPESFRFPDFSLPPDYAPLGEEFLIEP